MRGAAALALVAATAGCGDSAGYEPPRASAAEVDALLAAGCPRPEGVASSRPSARELRHALAGRFDVFDVPVRLGPPVDWTRDPIGAHRYRQNLYKLRFLDPLLGAYRYERDQVALRHALALGLDFAESLPRRGPDTPGEAWTDKVVGDRVPYLSFLTRAAACEGLLARDEASALLGVLRQHGEFLSEAERYVPDNHGLFADTGLVRLSGYLPFLEAAPEWKELGRERFVETLRGRLADGIWLEHSSSYQFLAIRAVEDFLELGPDPTVARLLAKMRRAAPWLVMPDGEMTQFGDSNMAPVPNWALRKAQRLRGMRVFAKAGFAVVRNSSVSGGPAYLAVTAGFHNLSHKHADECSFELYDRGHRVVTDTGLYHKDPSREREFVVSVGAHSTLTADGREFPIADSQSDYGSAVGDAGRGRGWFAIEVRNPLLREQGVRHERLFLYRPGAALVIVDRARSGEPHRYQRHVQLGPDVEVGERADRALALHAPGFQGALYDEPLGRAPRAERRLARGQRRPLAGFTSPQFRVFRPRWTVRFDSRAADAAYATSIALDRSDLRAVGASTGEGGSAIRLRSEGERRTTVFLAPRGGGLGVEVGTTAHRLRP